MSPVRQASAPPANSGGGGTPLPQPDLMSYADDEALKVLQGHVTMLADMGFERTLCQKAVGMFGDDMGAAVAWLTDDQAQHTLPVSPYISLYLPISP